MNPGHSRERLEERIASAGVPLASLTPHAGLEMMMCLYAADPADGYLTCSWGHVTRYGEEEFGFKITRHYEPNDSRADPPSYLSLVFKIGPPAVVGDLPSWMKWCADPEQLTTFRASIEETPAFQLWGQAPAVGVALVCEDLESWFRRRGRSKLS